MSEAVEIDVICDLSCPWSYIGKRRLERTIELLEIPVKIAWYPYLQAPDIPPGGIPRKDWLARTHGSPTQIRAALEPVKVAGLQDGIEFDFDAIKVMPNTLDAHRMVRWAAEHGKAGEMAERIYQQFFLEGQDISDVDVLAQAAEDIGLMDRFKARKMLESQMDLDAVWEDIKKARELKLKLVPAYIIAGKYAILGVDEPMTLAKAIQAADIERKEREER